MEAEFEALKENATLRAGLQALNSYKKVLIIDSEGRLKGTLTDGDIRRWLLKEGSLEASCLDACNQNPHTALSYSDAFKESSPDNIDYYVHIDANRKPVGIFNRKSSPRLPENTSCLLMAGGKGTRLRPLTLEKPKPLVEVGGKPMIDYTINKLSREGVKKIYLSVCYMKEMFFEYIGDGSNYGLDIDYIVEKEPLGTAGCIKKCLEDLQSDSHLLVANGDVMLNSHFTLFSDYHDSQSADATVVSKLHEITNPYGVLEIKEGVIKDIIEKPVYRSYVSAGIYYFNVNALEDAFQVINGYIDMPQLILDLSTNNKKVVCYPIHEEWHDLGTVSQLQDFESKMSNYEFL